jgi:hypothetical protein
VENLFREVAGSFSEVEVKGIGGKLNLTPLALVALVLKGSFFGQGKTVFYIKALFCSKVKQAVGIGAKGRDPL